jgi:kumamolisin
MSARKIFHDSVTELPDEPGVTPAGMKVNLMRQEDESEEMTLSFSLAIPKEAHDRLEALVARGEVITPSHLYSDYAVEPSKAQPLIDWLKVQGFTIEGVSEDRTSVFARGSVAQIKQSLEVKMIRVVKNGITYIAAQNAPSLPDDIAGSVHAIVGLQPFRQAHRHSRRVLPKFRTEQSFSDLSGGAAQPAPSIANRPPYLVQEVLKAYNADGLPLTGKGQEIAILIDTFPLDADLQAFWTRNQLNINLNQIIKINVPGGVLPPTEGEETLDAEWTSGIAPGATIRIYASGSLQFSALDRALDRILSDVQTHPGLRQLSVSLGLGDSFMPAGEVRVQHQKYLRLAAVGVNVFVSTGDAGSNPDSTGQGSNGPLQAEYASSDSAVIGVGGTTLVLAGNGSVSRETGWSDGGGGRSSFFTQPVWQKGPGVPTGGKRLVPDVSLTADPNDGALVILNGRTQQFGGTSWSAPVWAGFCALINEARVKAHKPALPFLNPLLYPLGGTACFRDVTSGSNGAFSAGPGYDLVTGLGVPNVAALIQALTR